MAAHPGGLASHPFRSLTEKSNICSTSSPNMVVMHVTRAVHPFQVVSDYQPSGDQPKAIAELTERIQNGERDVVLMGATGTGKSATAAWLIEKVPRPTLVLAHNKPLASQLSYVLR